MRFRDHVFQMQLFVTFAILGIGSALMFYFNDNTRFVVGVSLISGIVGYWLPNSNRSGHNHPRDVTLDQSEKVGEDGDNNAYTIQVISGSDEEDEKSESDNVPLTKDDISAVLSSLRLEKDSGSTKDIGGLTKSIRESVAKLESGLYGKNPHMINSKQNKSDLS